MRIEVKHRSTDVNFLKGLISRRLNAYPGVAEKLDIYLQGDKIIIKRHEEDGREPLDEATFLMIAEDLPIDFEKQGVDYTQVY